MRDFQLPGRSTVHARNGMCATSHPLAAQWAVTCLQAGGNAVDAAVSASLMLGLLEPAMTGIGGDAFALIWKDGEARPIGLNGSGRAPMALDAALLRAQGMTEIDAHGVHAASVPGAIDAFDVLLRDHGTYDWAQAVAPAVKLAREGHPVAPRVAFDWAKNAEFFRGDMQRHFTLDGRMPVAGDMIAYPAQAEALEMIGRDGRDAFYKGALAEDMVGSLTAMGGRHTMEDFAATKATYVDPISGTYRGTELIELPPNGQGATAILLAKILEGFDFTELDPFGPERAHIEAEATRLAYDARNRLIGDADAPDAAARLAHMLSDDTVAALRALINPMAARDDLIDAAAPLHAMGPAHGTGGAPHRDTIYITVVDKDRTMVSLIYSIYHAFGSMLASERYGINFQCRGAAFSLEEGHPNELKGGKRPLHTIIPGMLARDGKPLAAFGVMGGAYQATGHARLISNLVDYNMDAQEIMDAPRAFFDKDVLEVERGYSRSTLDRLGVMGHDARTAAGPIGGSQIIMLDHATGCLIGGSDPRKDGCALGY